MGRPRLWPGNVDFVFLPSAKTGEQKNTGKREKESTHLWNEAGMAVCCNMATKSRPRLWQVWGQGTGSFGCKAYRYIIHSKYNFTAEAVLVSLLGIFPRNRHRHWSEPTIWDLALGMYLPWGILGRILTNECMCSITDTHVPAGAYWEPDRFWPVDSPSVFFGLLHAKKSGKLHEAKVILGWLCVCSHKQNSSISCTLSIFTSHFSPENHFYSRTWMSTNTQCFKPMASRAVSFHEYRRIFPSTSI